MTALAMAVAVAAGLLVGYVAHGGGGSRVVIATAGGTGGSGGSGGSGLAAPSVASGGGGSAAYPVGSPVQMDHIFTRTTADGITVRAYLRNQDNRPVCPAGASCPALTCWPTAVVTGELSDDAAVSQAGATFFGTQTNDPLSAVTGGLFGVGEGSPAWWVVARTAPGVAAVRASFKSGGSDQMTVSGGWVILAHRAPPGTTYPSFRLVPAPTIVPKSAAAATGGSSPGGGPPIAIQPSPPMVPSPGTSPPVGTLEALDAHGRVLVSTPIEPFGGMAFPASPPCRPTLGAPTAPGPTTAPEPPTAPGPPTGPGPTTAPGPTPPTS